MSRVGKRQLKIPQGVKVTLGNDSIKFEGPKGILNLKNNPMVKVAIVEDTINVTVENAEIKANNSIWGTYNSLIENMIDGVSKGFEKKLEINGIGFKAAIKGKQVELFVGFSHPVLYNIPAGIEVTMEKNIITIKGIDKQLVGEVAANLRKIKKPEPYKGKGIKYVEETIRRKAGKAGVKAGAA